ncbi:hypothetical protein FOZ63_030633, partial [Perkinsus olseni]
EVTTNDRWDYQHVSLETAIGMAQPGLLANASSTETSGFTVTSLREVFTVHMPLQWNFSPSYFKRVDMSRPVNGNPTIRAHADSAANGASKAKADYYLEQYQSFNQDGQGCSPSELGHLLRLCGFSPTNAMIQAFEAEVKAANVEDPRVSPQQFLDLCGRCSEHLRQHTQLDLSAFFNPMDPGDTGLVSIKAFRYVKMSNITITSLGEDMSAERSDMSNSLYFFRAVMENAGEPFTREEVDIFIRDFSTDGLVLDYKAMIDTIYQKP